MEHIHTAVGMFNGGEVLLAYFTGEANASTEPDKERRRSVVLPMAVVFFFGIEVAMKALIEKQGQNPPHTHDLASLYALLDSSTQTRIEAKLNPDGVEVEALLIHHRSSFEQWRYIVDSGKDALVINPGAIAATLQAIIEAHTDLYGAGTTPAPAASGQGGVPPHVQRAAVEYPSMQQKPKTE